MTELEILAQLKHSYLSLEDIYENADGTQIEDKSYISITMTLIEKEYRQMYRQIKDMNDVCLYYEEDLLIADEVYLDYITESDDYDDQYITYKDIENESKWWEDYGFLVEFGG